MDEAMKLKDRHKDVRLNGWECYIINAIRAVDQLLELEQLKGKHEVTIDTGGFPECSASIQEIPNPEKIKGLWKIQVSIDYPTLDSFVAGARDLSHAKKTLGGLLNEAIEQAMQDNRGDFTTV